MEKKLRDARAKFLFCQSRLSRVSFSWSSWFLNVKVSIFCLPDLKSALEKMGDITTKWKGPNLGLSSVGTYFLLAVKVATYAIAKRNRKEVQAYRDSNPDLCDTGA